MNKINMDSQRSKEKCPIQRNPNSATEMSHISFTHKQKLKELYNTKYWPRMREIKTFTHCW